MDNSTHRYHSRHLHDERKRSTLGLSLIFFIFAQFGLSALDNARASESVSITYQLPITTSLPKSYRVTLAIVDPSNPDWIVSQFARGVVRTVTSENAGKFSETWDGLDDNFMPVPPGRYAVKGIYMPAGKWRVDGEYHSITPKFVGGFSAWLPSSDQWDKPEPFGGDPTNQPLGAVAVGPNGVGVFYYVYLENGLNCPMIDLNKSVDYGQFIRAFNSGGAAGGSSVATDGHTVWAFSTDGGPKFVFRADQKPFGHDTGANRNNVYRPQGWVTAMACWTGSSSPVVYVAQRGKLVEQRKRDFVESNAEFADVVTVHDGVDGKILASLPLHRPMGLVERDNTLYALHQDMAGGFVVSFVPLVDGLPHGDWQRVFAVPTVAAPFDLAVDSQSRFYISQPTANKVLQLDRTGKILRTIGRLDRQSSGTYDPLTLMSPGKLAAWRDSTGNDRLIIVEQDGPNRASEWSSAGKLLREFPTLQTRANDGYAVDPQNPGDIYVPGQGRWLSRLKLDYVTGAWKVDAVWPNVGDDPLSPNLDHPQFVRVGGREYLAGARSNNVYRRDADRWVLCAAFIREKVANQWQYFCWHDSLFDGKVHAEEYRKHPLSLPGQVFRYHGNQWLEDLSLVAINQGGRDVWRLSPDSFDSKGSPIFSAWKKLLADPVFEARVANTADAIHGGNELANTFSSDWAMVDGTMADGFYVDARGGPNFSANEGSQTKISRYVPDGRGGYRLKWRTGREAMQRLAEPGDIYGGIHLRRPINGLLSIVDQSRCGILLYTDEGLYVDTVFPDGRRFSPGVAGVYPQPGEFFAGIIYPNAQNGKIYFGMGKYTPMVFEAEGWSLKDNPVKPLETLQKTVDIAASQIASPPEIALSVRGGPGASHVARFSPALGGASVDGSMAGWESCQPVLLSADNDQNVEVRLMYDSDHLYLRWHARLGGKFLPRALQPVDRIFTHDRLADTLSFYFQSDPNAKPSGPPEGRAGDVRIVFGLFSENGKIVPVALGMYPKWFGAGRPSPLTYATPVGKAAFERVAPLDDVHMGFTMDDDGKGFALAAGIPRGDLGQIPVLGESVRTMANFSATFSGHNKFWWANRDGSASRETYDEPTEARLYPGSWAPAEFLGLGNGVVIRNWLVCGPFGGHGAEKFVADPRDRTKEDVRAFCEAAKYPLDDHKVELDAKYSGEQLQGYWPPIREVRWKPASIADLDTRIILGPSGQTWYGVTWIESPVDAEIEFQFQSHPQTFLSYFLNGKLVQSGEVRAAKDGMIPVSRKALRLQKGWNQLMFRGYCIGYPPFRAGLVLAGPRETLWKLKLAATPPKPE